MSVELLCRCCQTIAQLEIAAQLAELNEKLTPMSIVDGIAGVQAELEKQERELGIKA